MNKNIVLVRCMDKRHTDKIGQAVAAVLGERLGIYELTDPGGAGVLLGLFDEQPKAWLLQKISICLEKLHCSEIMLAVHGVSEHDGKPCGGYCLCGHEEKFKTSESSKSFLIEELRKAIASTQAHFPGTSVKGAYVTFGPEGENLVELVAA